MERKVGTIVRGVRAPIIRKGDDLSEIVVNSVLEAQESEGFAPGEKDVIAVTEAVVARAQGNYASVDDIAADVAAKFGEETVGVIDLERLDEKGINPYTDVLTEARYR